MNFRALAISLFTVGVGPNILASESLRDGFEGGTIQEQFWQIDATEGNCSIDPTKDISRSGDWSLVFKASGSARCEVVPHTVRGKFAALKRKFKREPLKKERVYRFSTFLEEPWEHSTKNVVLAQWHSSPDPFVDAARRGPPLALRIINGYFRISYGWDANFRSTRAPIAIQTLWYEPLETGQWIDWEFRVRWSYEMDGEIQVWKNGQLIVDNLGPNTFNDLRGVYLKLGVYHPGVERTVYFDDISVTDEQGSEVSK